jgi:hypothetical protein
MPKIEVVVFFKPYNIALGFKFKNLKYTALILNFEQKFYLNNFVLTEVDCMQFWI